MDINYIIFTHLPDDSKNDNAWNQFSKHAKEIGQILAKPTLWEKKKFGMLTIFTEPGWIQLLNTIGQDFNPVILAEDFSKIKAREDQFKKIIENTPDLNGRARLITAKTLYKILNNIRGNKSGETSVNLKKYLVAENPGVRYDTTKVVEAIIRIRHLGTGVTVIRMDWDALFNAKTLISDLKLITKDIPSFCEMLAKDRRIYSYMISGSYEKPENQSNWTLNDYNTAFATRMFPALIPNNKVIKKLNLLLEKKQEDGIEYKIDCELNEDLFNKLSLKNYNIFDRSVMEKYYGFNSANKGIASMGSHPETSVISGAALVLSDGAILDLPPFSNFRLNVMWIDDHLKYELHKALGHFEGKFGDDDAIPGRLDEHVYKDRLLAGQNNLRPYTFGVYIPTLFFGIIMDSWIRAENGKTSFVDVLENSLRRGTFSQNERDLLLKSLLQNALIRINQLMCDWSNLKTENNEKSFAALWIESDKNEIINILSDISPIPDEKWLGWGLLKNPGTNNASSIDDLKPEIAKCINELAEDMCNYIEWTLYWPNFVQSVRAIKPGSIPLDASFTE